MQCNILQVWAGLLDYFISLLSTLTSNKQHWYYFVYLLKLQHRKIMTTGSHKGEVIEKKIQWNCVVPPPKRATALVSAKQYLDIRTLK